MGGEKIGINEEEEEEEEETTDSVDWSRAVRALPKGSERAAQNCPPLPPYPFIWFEIAPLVAYFEWSERRRQRRDLKRIKSVVKRPTRLPVLLSFFLFKLKTKIH